MNLNLLRVFTEVARTGSFALAAESLGVERSSVSRSIASLEKEVGERLFSRTTRSMSLTTAGEALLAQIEPRLSSLQSALSDFAQRRDQPSGVLRISALGDMATTFLVPVLAQFCECYPGISVDLRVTGRLANVVDEGLDVALRVVRSKLPDSSLLAHEISPLIKHLYASPRYLEKAGQVHSPADAAARDWILYKGTVPEGVPPIRGRVVIDTDEMGVLHQAVKAGLGLGMMPTFLCGNDLRNGKLEHVLPQLCVNFGTLFLLHPPARRFSAKARVFKEFLLAHLRANPLHAGPPGRTGN
jgi:DNA-binding transcriptional LysR family regulator